MSLTEVTRRRLADEAQRVMPPADELVKLRAENEELSRQNDALRDSVRILGDELHKTRASKGMNP